jgi:hypothetical protein
MNFSIQRSNLRTLLELPSDTFLPFAFHSLTGRSADFIGLLHYARRLQQGRSRLLILAELASSDEAIACGASSPELEMVVHRYRRVRDWPLGHLRWALLPKVAANIPREAGFNWEHWANNYIADQLDREARHAVSVQSQRAADEIRAIALDTKTSDTVRQRMEQMQQQINHIAGVLQAQGVAVPVLPVGDVLFQLADPARLSPQARQYFYVLAQELSA